MQIDRPIAVIVMFFAVIALAYFLVFPEYETFGQLRTQLGEKRAEANAKIDYYAAIDKAFFDLQNRKDDIKKIDDALPQNPDLGQTIYFLQKTAIGNGMIIKNLFLSKSSQTALASTAKNAKVGIKDIVFSMNVTGDYVSLENFMIALEKSSRVFEITNISFGSSSQQSAVSSTPQFQSSQTYDFNLQIKTHSY
ncbi:MAG: type 4a pilus biogenesis protein PilO [Candidatus Staskawiczbacteria bacterium]|nr:type 4a pilus biogenesis protein PilO [Candidatus Staskawiczbacteria bacterium]